MTIEVSSRTRIGWVGAGHMGAAMAGLLVDAGHDVTVWNRTRAKTDKLAARGAKVAGSIAELTDLDVVFTMVSTSADLEQVTVGDGGLLSGSSAPKVLIDCSTVSAESSALVRAAAAQRDVAFLAAPVSGNGKAAGARRLSLVVSGPEDAFEATLPLLEALGAGVTYAGDGESARLVKICHNLFLGIVTQALAEITVLAEKGGVRRADFLAFINSSVMGSAFTRYKTPALVNLDFTPTFKPALLRKDFDLGMTAARALEVPMPVASLVHQLVQSLIGAGYDNLDFAVLLEQQARNSGLDLKPENVEVSDGLEVA
jgi:3-hydroxyisobutyrate dehydrogenase